MQRIRLAIGLAVGLSVLGYGHQASAQFGDMLKGATGGLSLGKKSSKSKKEEAAPAGVQPMGAAAGAAAAPLHSLGTDAVAVVEAAKEAGTVQEMDYVFAGQTIDLGKKGSLTLSYLSGCLTEDIAGGLVTVALGGSTVNGGKRTEKVTEGCEAAKPIIVAEASEAGATVNRATPFSEGQWTERTIKTAQPVFKWEQISGPVTVKVMAMDQATPTTVWESPADKGWVAYPASAPPLEAGMPYQVEVSGGGNVAKAFFSIDPGLDVADNLANRVVPVQVAGAR